MKRISEQQHVSHRTLFTGTAMVVAVAMAVIAYGHIDRDGGGVVVPTAAHLQYGAIDLLDGQWQYLPGVRVVDSKLTVQYRGFKIVEQDGTGGQPNPPVNEYGTHLHTTGGFAVTATLKKRIGPASIELYSSPPPISDEFRIEVPSVRMTVSNGNLAVNVWNGKATQNLANQQPIEKKQFKFQQKTGAVVLTVDDQNNRLSFAVNGRQVGHIPDEHTFNSHQVWFGLNAENPGDSFTVAALTAKPLNGHAIAAVNTAAETPVPKNPNGLQELASKKRPGFLIGSDIALWATTSNAQYNKLLFGGDFGIVTPENAMKWQFIEPQPGVYDFHEADALVNDALKNGLQVHGHNLVFSEALPNWVRNLPTQTAAQKAHVQQVMVNHITQLVTHFKGRVNEWDVVNEPIADYDNNGNFNTAQPYRENVFLRAMGPDYIKIALEAAHAADPSARLYINDYGNENDNGPRWQATYNMMEGLETALQPQGIDLYYGFESHIYDPTTDDISNDIDTNGKTILENNMNALGALGIKSRISEMDAPNSDPGYAEDSSSQVQQFTGVLQICLNNPNCVAFSMWSVGMTDLWQSDSHALQLGSVDSPFNQDNQSVQPLYSDLQNVLR